MTKEQNDLITRLVREYGDRLFWMANRYTANADIAEDMIQETMLTACCKIEVLATHENQLGWLMKTLSNLAKREMSKAHYQDLPLELDFIKEIAEMELPMEFYLPEGLDEKERTIILLRIGREMSYGEIADIMGISEDACRQKLSRTVRKCRGLMEKDGAAPLYKKVPPGVTKGPSQRIYK